MKVSLLSSVGNRILSNTGGEYLLDDLHTIIEIIPSDDEVILISYEEEEFIISDKIFREPVRLSNEYLCSFRISIQTDSFVYSLRYPGGEKIDVEHLANLMQLTESLRLINELNNGIGISIRDLMEGQSQGDISLLCVIKPLTGYDNNDLQEKLMRDLSQKVRSICSRPKRGTRTEEIIQDVGLVKKTSTNTLVHLASHTEHWKARTLTSLKPKRLLSVVIEDELNIYENLFFRAAITEISEYVTYQIKKLNIAGVQKKNADYISRYAEQMGDWKRAHILQELYPKGDTDGFFSTGISLRYQQSVEVWQNIDALLRNIRNSSFYRQISNKQRIGHEIYQTNIIRNDQRYHALYDLLISIRREKEKESKLHTGISDFITGNPSHFYANYIIVLLLWCMIRKLDVVFDENSVFQLDSQDRMRGAFKGEDSLIDYRFIVDSNEYDQLSIRIEMQEKGNQSFRIPDVCRITMEQTAQFEDLFNYENNIITFKRRPSADEITRLRRLFQKKTSSNRTEINKAWIEFIDNNIARANIRTLHKSSMIIYPIFYSLGEKDRLIPRLLNQKDDASEDKLWIIADSMLDPDSKQNDIRNIINYGELPPSKNTVKSVPYHHSVLPAMQVDSLSSQRIIKYLTIKRADYIMKWEEKQPSHCPLCLSEDIRKVEGQTWQCKNCKSKWGKTRCVAEKSCGDFSWVWPDDDHLKSLRNEDVTEKSEIRRAQRRDIVFGASIITDFEYDFRSNGEIQLLPICPYCGKRRSENESSRKDK